MAYALKLEIVTPEAKVYSNDVDMVTLHRDRRRNGHFAEPHAVDDPAVRG